MNKTLVPQIDSLERQWFLVDAADQTLGRLASEVAQVLRGKNNPNFTPTSIPVTSSSSSTPTRSGSVATRPTRRSTAAIPAVRAA